LERLNYREVVDKLDAIDRRLCDMGLSQFDRIRIHRRNITELAEASENGTLDQIAADLTSDRRRQILWSFVESIELVDAIDALERRGCTIPKHMFERALQGPADLYFEDQKSNQGRNTMFEIAIAAAAAHAGCEPKLGGEPNVLFSFNGRNASALSAMRRYQNELATQTNNSSGTCPDQ